MTTIRSDANAGIVIDSDTSGALTFVTGNSNIALQINSSGTIDLSSSRFILPIGNTASRPAAVPGLLRFNNEFNVFEVFAGNTWEYVSTYIPPSVTIEYLVVAGGGGAGNAPEWNAGGGAGGAINSSYSDILPNITSLSYTVTVGSGGAGGSQGSNSIVFNNVIAIGGGRGGQAAAGGLAAGGNGGSGGGGSANGFPGGLGAPGQGYPGGSGSPSNNGGGGGAGGAGGSAFGATAGTGGIGIDVSITGSNVTYAAGGTGGNTASNGTENRGNGGSGGGGTSATSAGGSGIVILKYPSTLTLSNPGAGLTYTTDSANVAGYNITTFTAGTGEIQWS